MTNEGAIERIKILKAFTGYDKDNQMVTELHEALDMAIISLKEPQPQIKKGKWIDGYCSECGKSCLCDGWGNDIESKFCPECGSFNGGGEDGNSN